jgi:hypothetical protein
LQTFWLVLDSVKTALTVPVAVPFLATTVPTAGVGAPAVALYHDARQPLSGVPAWVMLPPLAFTEAVTEVSAWLPPPVLVIVYVAVSVPEPGNMGPPEKLRAPTDHDDVDPVVALPEPDPEPPVK